MKRILITGSNGFTGQYIANVFESENYQVIRHVFNSPKNDNVACDLTDKAAVFRMIKDIQPNGVIHLAALSFVGHEDLSAFYKVNVLGAMNVLEALGKASIQPDKVIIASSANIYGNPDVEIIDESTPPNPVNHYAASKLAMEFMVKTWFSRFPIIITRPFNYTGQGQDAKFLVPKIVDHFRGGKNEIELGNLDVARDFSDVRDVAQSYLKLYESPAESEVVNLCSGKVHELGEIISMMNNIAGYQIKVKVNPDFVRENEIKVLRGDNSRLQTLTGFTPKIDLSETLQDMFKASS